MTPILWHSGEAHYKNHEKTIGFPMELEGRGNEWAQHREFLGQWSIVYKLMMDTRNYKMYQTHRICNTKREP